MKKQLTKRQREYIDNFVEVFDYNQRIREAQLYMSGYNCNPNVTAPFNKRQIRLVDQGDDDKMAGKRPDTKFRLWSKLKYKPKPKY